MSTAPNLASADIAIHSARGPTLRLSLATRELQCCGRSRALKSTPCRLMYLLAQHQNQIVSRQTILKEIWGYEFEPGTKIIEVQICYLRNVLAALTSDFAIKTFRGKGLSLCQP